jgi:PAS domain S-box-containing protein
LSFVPEQILAEPEKSPASVNASEEIRALIETWLNTGERLEETTGGEVDSVTDRNGRTFLLWRAQEQLRHAERKMRQHADSMPHMVWTTSGDGKSDYFNQRCYDYTGLTFDQMKGGGWLAKVHPDDREKCVEQRTGAMTSDEPYTMEFRLQRASDGMYRWHLSRGISASDFEGTLATCWIGTFTDIHSMKLAEAALRTSQMSFMQLADSMPQMVWTATPDGQIDYHNQAWYDYTGTNFEQTRNWGWTRVVHPADLEQTVNAWIHAFTTGEPYKGEFRIRCASRGEYRWHLGRALPIRDEQGVLARWFGTCTDVDDYKQSEAKIRALNEGPQARH